MSDDSAYGSVRYIVQDVQAAINFYTTNLGFTLRSHPAPPFADVTLGSLRVLLSGPGSSGARATPAGADGPAATGSTCSSPTSPGRSTGSARPAYRCTATWSAGPVASRSSSPTPTATSWSSSRPPGDGRQRQLRLAARAGPRAVGLGGAMASAWDR